MNTDRKNIVFNSLGEGMWGFGWGLVPTLTVLPLLVDRLGGSKIEIGLIATIASICVLTPQVVSTLLLQTGEGRKRFVINYHWFAMIPPWIVMGLAVLLAAPRSPLLGRILLLSLFAVFMLTIGFILPVWTDWVAGLFPKEKRGIAFGAASAASAAGGTVAALIAGRITGASPFPLGYAVIIFIGAAAYAVAMLPYRMVDEHAHPPRPRMTSREVFRRFRLSLADPNYRRYLVSRLLLTAGTGPVAFFATHYKSLEGGAVAEDVVISLGAVAPAAQAVMGFALGRLGDLFGHKSGAVIGAAAHVAGLIVVILLKGPGACALVFGLTGLGIACAWVSHNNLLFETCPHDCRMAHITVTNLVLAPLTAAVPLITGRLVEAYGIVTTARWCLVPVVVGLGWLIFVVREPRAVPFREER